MVLVVGFQALKLLPLVQEINQLTAIDLKKANCQVKFGIVSQLLDDVICCQQVLAWNSAIRGAHHGEGFARSCLTVSEAGSVRALEKAINEGLHTLVKDHLVVVGGLKTIVKSVLVLLTVLCEIDPLLNFFQNESLRTCN